MDEETVIIDSNTRNEKIRNFFVNNKKPLLTILLVIVFVLVGYFTYVEYRENKRLEISDQYNSTVNEYTNSSK